MPRTRMEEILRLVEPDKSNEKRRCFTTKKGLNEFHKNKSEEVKNRLIKNIIRIKQICSRNTVNKLSFRQPSLGFSVVYKKGKEKEAHPWRTEEALERFIIKSNGKNFHNQMYLGKNGADKADIIIKNENGNKLMLIELKPWENDNNPLYALLECIKNYFLLKNILEKVGNDNKLRCNNLIILAPQKYYEKHKIKEGNLPLYENLITMQEEKLGVTVEFKEIDYDETKFNETCINLAKPFNNGQWTRSKNTEQYDFRKNVNAKDIEVVENLKYKNWVTYKI